MLNLLRRSLSAGLLLLCTVAGAQTNSLFASYDCRKHAEAAIEPIIPVDSAIFTMDIPEPVVIDTVDGWMRWSYVENYAFGKDRGVMPMITDLEALHPVFRDKIRQLIADCRKQGIELAVVESYRTHAKQNEYRSMGKKYTNSKGGTSKHQYGLAVDLVPIVNAVAVWDNTALWKKVGVTGEKLGLRWGGRWRKPYDPGHFEWTLGLTATQLQAGLFPKIQNKEESYPCLDEDLKLLKKYWREWQISQSAITRK